MSNDILKILIESACKDGSISSNDRKLIENKAQQLGIPKASLDKMIEEAISTPQPENDDDLESGFISIEDSPTPPPPPASTKTEARFAQSKFTDVKPLSTQGAMSEVSQAKLHGKWIIIKRIKPKYKDNAKYRDLFLREFENAYHLDHPHIVRLLDKGEDAEGLYYTMEYVDGRPMSELIKNNGIKNDAIAESIARQILDALAYVHKKQIFHRDLKPDNIYVTFRGDNVKILDFGLAAADNYDDDLLKVGTPRYAAPEQMTKGFAIDQRADIYSFGKIFLEILTGKVDANAISSIKNNAYRHIINKALSENPQDRFHDCEEIIRILNNPQSVPAVKTEQSKEVEKKPEPVKTEQPKEKSSTNKNKKTPLIIILIIVFVLGLAAGAYLFFKSKGASNNEDTTDEPKIVNTQKADSLYDAGFFLKAQKEYEALTEKTEEVNSKLITLNKLVKDYEEIKKLFDSKNIIRAKTKAKELLLTNPNFIALNELLTKCDNIIKNANFSDLELNSESGSGEIKYGVLDKNGNVIVDFQFDNILIDDTWQNIGLIPVVINEKYGFIDRNFNYFAKCEYNTKCTWNKALAKSGRSCLVCDDNGKEIIISVDENGNGKIEIK